MSLFQTQTNFKIRLDCGQDISSATVRRILYKKPDGTNGSWDAILSGTNFMEYQIEAGDIDQSGPWQIQSYAEISGLTSYGDLVSMSITKPLNI